MASLFQILAHQLEDELRFKSGEKCQQIVSLDVRPALKPNNPFRVDHLIVNSDIGRLIVTSSREQYLIILGERSATIEVRLHLLLALILVNHGASLYKFVLDLFSCGRVPRPQPIVANDICDVRTVSCFFLKHHCDELLELVRVITLATLLFP